MYTVHFAGLVYFKVCSFKDKRALLPDGTESDGTIAPHYASLWVEPGQYESDDWWPTERFERTVKVVDDLGDEQAVKVLEFRIPSHAEIRFSEDGEDSLDLTNVEQALPKLHEIDPSFEVDPTFVETIAEVPIHGGQIEVFGFCSSAIVRWTIARHSGPIKITAGAGDQQKSLTLKTIEEGLGTEIVFSNTADLISSECCGKGDFRLYGKLNKSRKADNLVFPGLPKGLVPLPTDHDYLRSLATVLELADPECTPTCC